MTNKEAAKIIEMLFHDSTNEDYPFTEEFGKACKLAIEALMESEKYKRMILLLEKCLELFRKEEECPYLINILAETIKLIKDLDGARLLRKPHLLDYEETIEIIKMSATEIEEIRHGKWIMASDGVYCSICGEPSAPDDYDAFWGPYYCPNCGANMRGEKND